MTGAIERVIPGCPAVLHPQKGVSERVPFFGGPFKGDSTLFGGKKGVLLVWEMPKSTLLNPGTLGFER